MNCPACGTQVEEKRELGSTIDAPRNVDLARYECAGCRAVVGREWTISASARQQAGPPFVVMTGAAVARALEPLERKARGGDRPGILDELRALDRDAEKPFLAASESVQRLVRGMPLRLVRHLALPVLNRPPRGARGPAVDWLFDGQRRLRLAPVRVVEDLDLTGDQLDDGGVILPDARVFDPRADMLLLLAGTRVTAQGAEVGLLRLAPPDPKPTLFDWGKVESLLAPLNVVAPD